MTDDQKKQLEEWRQRLPKCGCGRVARYETSTGLACNKYMRCDNAEFMAEQIESLRAQLAERDAEIAGLHEQLEEPQITSDLFNITNEQLASAQAENSKLREALNRLQEAGNGEDDNEFYAANSAATKILSTPSDTSALAEYVARAGEVMRERAIEEATNNTGNWAMTPGLIRALPGVTIKDISNG